MRGRHVALPTVLAWLGLLCMLLTGLPALEHAVQGTAAVAAQQPVEDRTLGGGEITPQEEAPAKPRRVASVRPAAAPQPAPAPPVHEALDVLMATLAELPPQIAPAIDSAPATPLPAAPGLRVQRGQAPPRG